MPKEKIEQLYQAIDTIEDSLGDLCLPWVELKCINHSKPRLHLHPGYYVQYRIYEGDVDRVFFLGDGSQVKKLERNFTLWSQNWRV